MVFDFFRSGQSSIDEVETKLVEMMREAKDVYNASTGAVFGGGKSPETKATVKATDKLINENQQDVRRMLLMASSVRGAAELPLILTYMSVVKDVERVGDYAKNIYDLAKYGVDFTASADRADLEQYRTAVGNLIDEAATVFEDRNADRAQELVTRADRFLKEYDKLVKAAANSDASAFEAVNRALYFRFLKRITAHVMNLLTALILPVDLLDYYDEAPEDRG